MACLTTQDEARKGKPKFSGWILLVLISLISLTSIGCATEEPEMETYGSSTPVIRHIQEPDVITAIEGEDYSLPDWCQPEEYSGFIGDRDIPRPEGSMKVENWYVSWAYLEPEKGQYNWDYVDQRLAAAAEGGYKLNMHLQSITYGGGDDSRGIVVSRKVPDWVLEEFDLTEDDLINLGWEFDLLIIPGWHAGISEAFNDLIRAFGERGYPQSPQIASAYIHAISPSRGEEFWMTQSALDVLEDGHGFNKDSLDGWITSRFDAYGDAFAGVTHKLVWVGKQGAWRYLSSGEYADLAMRLVEDAWAMGAGNRSSAVEIFNTWLNEPALGQEVNENGYMTVDESLPPMNSVRFFGDENEEYGEEWIGRYGSLAGEPLRFRFSMLRSLQMRMRFLWTCPEAEVINSPLHYYVGMSLGKDVNNSPDAWSYLRESPVSTSNSPVAVVKNFERWLTQRDFPRGMTVPTQRTFREFYAGSNHGAGPDQWYDDLARRTDIESGNDFIYFDLDDRFNVSGAVQIKVEILDDSQTSWHIEYTNTQHNLTSTDAYPNQGDGMIKTVSFTINEPSFLNGLENNMDFRIVCDGPGDVTVRWVRLVRMNEI